MAARDQSDLLSSGAGLAATVAVEVHGELGGNVEVKARGYWEQVWLRLRRDRVAIAGGIFIVVLLLVAFVGAPLAERALGHGPNDVNTSGGLDPSSQLPVGPWTTVTTEPYPGAPGSWEDTLYILGADSQLGRDMFLRLLYGAQTSLQVAILATLLSVSIGLIMGLIAPLIVFSTLIVATNVIAEAGLSFLGLGIPAPTASWGNLLAEGPNYYLTQPWLMVWPGLAILLTTLAFNLLGDGLRDAFDPRSARWSGFVFRAACGWPRATSSRSRST